MTEKDVQPPIAHGRARAILLGIAAGYVAFGVAFLLAPAKMAGYFELGASSRIALMELRAFYGGIELGLGAFLAITALRKSWHSAGLLAALLSLLGIASARVYAISLEGSASFVIYAALLIEVFGVLAAGFGLVDARKQPGPVELTTRLGAGEEREALGEPKVDPTLPIERTKTWVERTVKLDKK
jgi:hypothetical protein